MCLQVVHNERVTAGNGLYWPLLASSILNHFGQLEPLWQSGCRHLSPPPPVRQ
jgi:hypothetical protein